MTGGWLTGFLIALLPLLVLVGLLLAGRYPGEKKIQRWRALILAALRLARAGSSPCPASLPAPVAVRGGRLIARSLAGRGPPALPVIST